MINKIKIGKIEKPHFIVKDMNIYRTDLPLNGNVVLIAVQEIAYEPLKLALDFAFALAKKENKMQAPDWLTYFYPQGQDPYGVVEWVNVPDNIRTAGGDFSLANFVIYYVRGLDRMHQIFGASDYNEFNVTPWPKETTPPPPEQPQNEEIEPPVTICPPEDKKGQNEAFNDELIFVGIAVQGKDGKIRIIR